MTLAKSFTVGTSRKFCYVLLYLKIDTLGFRVQILGASFWHKYLRHTLQQLSVVDAQIFGISIYLDGMTVKKCRRFRIEGIRRSHHDDHPKRVKYLRTPLYCSTFVHRDAVSSFRDIILLQHLQVCLFMQYPVMFEVLKRFRLLILSTNVVT